MAREMTGGCACGRVRYSVNVTDEDAFLCHCRMCQRATGSLSIALKCVKNDDVHWQGEPDWYQSSPIAKRPFCSACGTSLGFRFTEGSPNMDLTVASFDVRQPLFQRIISEWKACTGAGSIARVFPRSAPRITTLS